ncbi:MAG: EF-hand domain-containing protein [Thermoguttaceae bacterium]
MTVAGILGGSRLLGGCKVSCHLAGNGVVRAFFPWAVVLGVAGCWKSGPPRISPELPDFSAAKRAMEMYDTNHDGLLDEKELEKVPGLKVALERLDTDHDGKISEKELADRIKSWASSRAGRVPVRVRVLHNGQPLSGAQVVLVPEKFLGAAILSGSGSTSEHGTASISASSPANPNVRGLSPGFYRVEITKDGEDIPARYNTETILGAEASGDDQKAALVFDLNY